MRSVVLVLSLAALTVSAQQSTVVKQQAGPAAAAKQQTPVIKAAEDPCAGRLAKAMEAHIGKKAAFIGEVGAIAPIEVKPTPLPDVAYAQVDPLTAANNVWKIAADEVLGLVESLRDLTETEKLLLAQSEEGRTDQQKFAGRLALLKAIANP